MILDTCLLIDTIHGDPDAVRCATELETTSHKLRVSAMTMTELQVGVTRSDNALEEFTEMVEVADSKEIVPVSREIALRGGRLHGESKNRGEEVGLLDCLIAATALAYEEPVVTRNVDHFERFDGVLIHEY